MSDTQRACIASVARHQDDVRLLCTRPEDCSVDSRVRVQKLDVELQLIGTPLQRWFATTALAAEGRFPVNKLCLVNDSMTAH